LRGWFDFHQRLSVSVGVALGAATRERDGRPKAREANMQVSYGYGLAMLAGAALGAAAMGGVGVLHAQSKSPVYGITEIEIMNSDAYAREFLAKVGPMNIAAGGHPLIRTSGKITPIEGEPPKTRITVSAWDSVEHMKAWYNSAQYRELRKVGEKYAKFIRSYTVEGVAP
jgi:uncharacterized protein (DUF1330 family)